tara:strand:- start:27553 stop:27696 length:144 start_codon:yes stop_codon:yes gene_type:complete
MGGDFDEGTQTDQSYVIAHSTKVLSISEELLSIIDWISFPRKSTEAQ